MTSDDETPKSWLGSFVASRRPTNEIVPLETEENATEETASKSTRSEDATAPMRPWRDDPLPPAPITVRASIAEIWRNLPIALVLRSKT